jgi:hypothetical protein
MSGYTPVFGSVFTGTLHGRWPDTGLWLCLLAMANKHGEVDCTPQYIASNTGLDAATVAECIERFMAVDQYSRSPESEGRRLELIDPARPWGWRIVNHGKYRERARKQAWDADRTASGRDAERKRESRRVPTSPAPSRLSPLSDADTDTDSDSDVGEEGEREGEKSPSLRSVDPPATPPKALNGKAKPNGKAKQPNPAHRIPAEFPSLVTPELGEWTRKALPNVDLEAFVAEFVDYWTQASGPTSKKLNWIAAYRVRVRNCERYPMLAAQARQPDKVVRYDANGRLM